MKNHLILYCIRTRAVTSQAAVKLIKNRDRKLITNGGTKYLIYINTVKVNDLTTYETY